MLTVSGGGVVGRLGTCSCGVLASPDDTDIFVDESDISVMFGGSAGQWLREVPKMVVDNEWTGYQETMERCVRRRFGFGAAVID